MSEVLKFYSGTTGRAMGVIYFIFIVVLLSGMTIFVVDVSSHMDKDIPWFLYFLITLGVLVGGLFIVMLFRNMLYALTFGGKPVLILNENGITEHTRAISLGFVSWDDVEEILPCEFMSSNNPSRRLRQEYGLGLKLKNRDRFVARYDLLTRIMFRMNSGKSYFIIPVTNLELNEEYREVNAFVSMVGRTFDIKVGEYRKVGDGK